MGFDVGGFVTDAAKTAGQIITHPADDASTGWDIAIHPEDDFNTVVKVGPDFLAQRVKDFGHMTSDVGDFMSSNFNKFAQSDLGKFVLTKMAGSEYMALVPMIGPAALLIFAIPGLLQGQDFGPAWLDGTIRQAQDALKAVSGGNVKLDMLPPEVQQHIADISSQYFSQIGTATQYLNQPGVQDALKASGLPDISTVTPEQVAQHLGIREDAAWSALDNLRQNAQFHREFVGSKFDPSTGRRLSARERAATNTFNKATAVSRLAAMMSPTDRAVGNAFNVGQAVISKSKTLQAASLFGGSDPAFTRGFTVAIGALNSPISTTNFAALRAAVQPNERKGFDAGIAVRKGLPVAFGRGGFASFTPSHLAGMALAQGLIGAPPAIKIPLLTAAAKDGQARTGILQQGNSIMAARAAAANPSLWQRFLAIFGL
jgi:hypothetical protein